MQQDTGAATPSGLKLQGKVQQRTLRSLKEVQQLQPRACLLNTRGARRKGCAWRAFGPAWLAFGPAWL